MRYHPQQIPRAADPGANRHDWANDIRPVADIPVPDGHLLIRMANAHPTSAGNTVPDQVLALPDDEARTFVRQGFAVEVRRVPGAALPPSRYVDPRAVYAATRGDR